MRRHESVILTRPLETDSAHLAKAEMNPSHVEELRHAPTALEFSRFVQRNRPVIFRGLGFDLQIPAMQRWTEDYLKEKLGDSQVKIAATPEG